MRLKKLEEADKAAKKAREEAAFKRKKEELKEELSAIVSKGLDHIKTISNSKMKDLLKYYWEDKTAGIWCQSVRFP